MRRESATLAAIAANSGLGCPQPRIQYLQVITAGHALRFAAADGRTHTVNVAGDTIPGKEPFVRYQT